MGAWEAGNFENDSAMDWVGDLLESGDASFIHATFHRVLEHDGTKRTKFLWITRRHREMLPADIASQALAAAEIIAAWRDRPLAKLPKGVTEWLEHNKPFFKQELVTFAQQAINKVKTDSELKTLWEEGDPSRWQNAVADLERRLSR
jgi:hypothetical protein